MMLAYCLRKFWVLMFGVSTNFSKKWGSCRLSFFLRSFFVWVSTFNLIWNSKALVVAKCSHTTDYFGHNFWVNLSNQWKNQWFSKFVIRIIPYNPPPFFFCWERLIFVASPKDEAHRFQVLWPECTTTWFLVQPSWFSRATGHVGVDLRNLPPWNSHWLAPENGWLVGRRWPFLFWVKGLFSGAKMLVSGRVRDQVTVLGIVWMVWEWIDFELQP